jgi:hypothetical protein
LPNLSLTVMNQLTNVEQKTTALTSFSPTLVLIDPIIDNLPSIVAAYVNAEDSAGWLFEYDLVANKLFSERSDPYKHEPSRYLESL